MSGTSGIVGTIIGIAIVALAIGILAWKIYGSVTGKGKSSCGCSGCSGCQYAGSCDSFASTASDVSTDSNVSEGKKQ